MTTRAAPDENALRDALFRIVQSNGVEPDTGSLAVRRVAGSRGGGAYMVVIAYRAARAALSRVLPHSPDTGGSEHVGVWVLSETEVRRLCEVTD